jgi:hypothetical protein
LCDATGANLAEPASLDQRFSSCNSQTTRKIFPESQRKIKTKKGKFEKETKKTGQENQTTKSF